MSNSLNDLVSAAQQGDRAALEGVVRSVQDRVHHLAMRMLVDPDDALEASQEILILVVTKLSTFRGDSAFHTWVYRVAANYLVTAKRVRERDHGLNFEMFRSDLEGGLVPVPEDSGEDVVMLNELRISCTMAMLLCLDLKHRIAYVLGDMHRGAVRRCLWQGSAPLELEHGDAAGILGISKPNYRQRLSRARGEVVAFTSKSCGLANETAICSCPRQLPAALASGRVRRGQTAFALPDAPDYRIVAAEVRQTEAALRTLKLQNATPQFRSPADLAARIAEIVTAPT